MTNHLKLRFCTKRLLPWLFFLPVVMGIFSPWWYQGKVLAPLDIITNLYAPWADPEQPVQVRNHFATDATEQYLLYHHHANHSYQTEGRWGWNYLKSCGTPEYRNTMATPGDWSMQLHRFLPFWPAWHLGIMGQMLIAMFGMYRLLRAHHVRRDLSILGGLAFGLNAHFFAWIYHRWTLGAFCWTPWWIWAMGALRRGKRAGGLAPIFLALSMLGGHLQFVAYQMIMFAIVVIDGVLESVRAGDPPIKPLLKSSAVMALALGLSAFALIPTTVAYLDTLAFGIQRGSIGYPNGILGIIKNVAAYPAYVVPFLFGISGAIDLFKLFKADLMNVPFFGSLLMLLSLVSIFHRSQPRAAR